MTPSYRAWLKAKLDELDRQYGTDRHATGATRGPDLAKSPINCPGAGAPAGSGQPPSQRYTDEFTIGAKDIIDMLVENEKGIPIMICGGCGAPCREWPPGLATCTICNELKGR